MQAEKLHDIAKSKFSGNLNQSYQWFYEHFFSQINTSIKEFLSKDIDIKLVSISEKDNILFGGDDYFVTKLRITKEINVLFRVSKPAIELILDGVLGENDKRLELEDLTELEAKLLTSLNDFLYKSFSSQLISSEKHVKKAKNANVCHFTFFVKGKSEKLGKIIITLPIAIIPEIPKQEPVFNFEIDSFPTTLVPVDLRVGTTRISLSDLKNIELEDIVVLEKSNINKMSITIGDIRKTFRLSPDPSLIISVDDNGGKIMDENITQNQNMWDSIQVDISAEFEQVKIPLGDLRQISEGLVVDIGSVYENKIDLRVEDKIIASGELVIINDRYGVRVDTLYKDDEVTQSPSSTEVDQEELAKVQADDFDEEDFDYSNFEIEDENI